MVRLSQIAHATESHSAGASLVEARTIVTLSGFPPPTLHAMGTRVATQYPPRQFNLLITNVPGPQSQMYVAGEPGNEWDGLLNAIRDPGLRRRLLVELRPADMIEPGALAGTFDIVLDAG